jgi:predicted ATPase/DNA-binding winged helix-turn-helix (wHTH) protein
MERIRFGSFELYPSERRLLDSGKPVELGGRAFDLLRVLAENAGRLVSKATLLERVWPRLVVDENNLPAQVASLRRVLGAGAIRTVPGFGYRFELAVEKEPADGSAAAIPVAARSDAARVPAPVATVSVPAYTQRLAPLVGRGEDLAGIEARLGESCLVSIVGGAGVGKTRLAQELLARAATRGSSVLHVPLEPLSDAGQLPAAVSLALGTPLPEQADEFMALASLLAPLPLLLLLDGAERLAPELAPCLTALLDRCPQLTLLVSSQVPLGVAVESVYRVPELALPAADAAYEAVCASPAVALFVQRASAADHAFRLEPGNATTVATICRRLDGNALALELAAARLPSLGALGLLQRLDDRLRLLRSGQRAGEGRHGTLQAALDWSYELLATEEQKVFRRLGAFAGSFAIDSAAHCVAGVGLDVADAIDIVGRLVDRSLLGTLPGDPPRYILSESARLYAREQLTRSGELAEARARMAAAMLERLDGACADYWSLDEAIWLQRYLPDIDNVRAAIDWAAGHDGALAVALYGSSWPLYAEAEFAGEARSRFEQNVRALARTLPPARVARFWEAVAVHDSMRQRSRAGHAAQLAAQLHAEAGDKRAQYFDLVQLALNSDQDTLAARAALDTAHALEDAAWPPRLLTHGALAEGAWHAAAGDYAQASEACRRALRLALSVSERLALTATVHVVELDLVRGDFAAAIALGRPLEFSLQRAGRRRSCIAVQSLLCAACLLDDRRVEALQYGAELHRAALGPDADWTWLALEAMALLALRDGRDADAARVLACADAGHEARGGRERGPAQRLLRERVVQGLAAAGAGPVAGGKAVAAGPAAPAEAIALALGI